MNETLLLAKEGRHILLKSVNKEIVCDISGKVRRHPEQNGLKDYLVMKLNQPPNNFYLLISSKSNSG
jgi:hypothetical protein